MTQHQLSTCGTSALYIIFYGESYPLRVLLGSEGTAGEAEYLIKAWVKGPLRPIISSITYCDLCVVSCKVEGRSSEA